MGDRHWIQWCDDARKGRGPFVLLEGIQPLKHALRFGAEVIGIYSCEPEHIIKLAYHLAPDVAQTITSTLTPVSPNDFLRASGGRELPSPVLSLARKPTKCIHLSAVQRAKLVLIGLTHPGNVGAAIRIAAAFGWGAVVCVESPPLWHPLVVRAAAGLHWAIPTVAWSHQQFVRHMRRTSELLMALSCRTTAEPLTLSTQLPTSGWYLVGSERKGLPSEVEAMAHRLLTIPMQEGVSSINVAAACAIVTHLVAAQAGWVGSKE